MRLWQWLKGIFKRASEHLCEYEWDGSGFVLMDDLEGRAKKLSADFRCKHCDRRKT